MEFSVRPLAESDIASVAKVFAEAFNSADVGESWTDEEAEKFIRLFFERVPELLFVAEKDGEVIGGVFADVKPYADGDIILTDGHVFVSPEHQRNGVATELLKKLLKTGTDEFGATMIVGTADGVHEFPMNYYKRLGFAEMRWKVISSGIAPLLKKLER